MLKNLAPKIFNENPRVCFLGAISIDTTVASLLRSDLHVYQCYPGVKGNCLLSNPHKRTMISFLKTSWSREYIHAHTQIL